MLDFNDYVNFSGLGFSFPAVRSINKDGSGGSINSNYERKTIMSKFQNSPVATMNTQRIGLSNFGHLALAAMILIGAVLFTGCSTLPSSLSSGGLFSSAPQSSQTLVATGSQAQYLVDMQVSYGGNKKYKGVIDQGTTVQSAIEASGATKKFRKMDVVVMRKIEGAYKPLKMTCDYNSTKKMIRPESDYALQHGDRIVITPKSENQLLQMLGSFGDGK